VSIEPYTDSELDAIVNAPAPPAAPHPATVELSETERGAASRAGMSEQRYAALRGRTTLAEWEAVRAAERGPS
jgi:hypothetical protein